MTTASLMVENGNFLAATDFATDVETGVTRSRYGRRVVSLGEDFLVGFHEALVDECGDAASEVLDTCGRTFGELWARSIADDLEQFYGTAPGEFPAALFLACIRQALRAHGWGDTEITFDHAGQGVLCVEHARAPFAELLPESNRPADSLVGGMLAGLLSHFAGQDLLAIQTECPLRGDARSYYVLALRERIRKLELPESGTLGTADALEALSRIEAQA